MATSLYPAECVLDLPDGWVDARKFERALLRCGDVLAGTFTSVVIRLPAGCKLMIDVVIRLLSFCNQVVATTRRLRYKADLDVRLLQQRVLLKPANGVYLANTAFSQDGLPLLWGTHIAFSLQLG